MLKSLKKILNLKTVFKIFLEALQRVIYPAVCLHCEESLPIKRSLLCTECFDLLELIPFENRCFYCFSISEASGFCACCNKHPPNLHRLAATFDYQGPVVTLIRRMNYSNQDYLSEGLASYMVMQFLKLGWPKPDVIIPVPISFTEWIHRGYNQNQLLAKEIGALLECPVQEVLGRYSKDYRRSPVNQSSHELLKEGVIFLKKKESLQDKTLLLIQDVLVTGATFRECTEVLDEDYPFRIYGLAACRK